MFNLTANPANDRAGHHERKPMLKTAKTYPLTVLAVAAALMTYATFIMSILAVSMTVGNILAVIGASIAACVTWDYELTINQKDKQ